MSKTPLRMGRISYLNVLPIYHPLESGIIPHDFELVSAPPAVLNDMMGRGELVVSSCSCFEYARRPDRYYLVEDLSIGSHGPVMSVLLFSRRPIGELAGRTILISGESHTSVALLRLLMRDRYHVDVAYETGQVTPALRSTNPPEAFLAIGDEALRLRGTPDYPCCIDMAEAWRDWTGLPFIFGLWVVSREAADRHVFTTDPGDLLRRGRDWGMAHLDVILDLTAYGCPLSREELRVYYEDGLVYTLGDEEQKGLTLFYKKLAQAGMINAEPPLVFFQM
ncbi:MAG: menaquinone biosynthesis protein [Desulfovibrio sp.]|nr:menaquinone biosynthesis protein [Desulfovibrio sp.]